MAIAWDNAKTRDTPVRWDMRRVLSLSNLLDFAGVLSSFLAYWAAKNWLGVPDQHIQTAMFLKLLVAGHFTLYLTRQRGWFFNKPWPSLWLIAALEATQIGGTLIAAFGLLMPALDWQYVAMIWGYALLWFLLLDGCKRLTYAALERTGSTRGQHTGAAESA